MQTVEPIIAELFRTLIPPKTLFLNVENVELIDRESFTARQDAISFFSDKSDPRMRGRYVGRFWLSDGELMIQALLHRRLDGQLNLSSVRKGDLVEIRRFTVHKARRVNGQGKVVFLGLEDCTFLAGIHNTAAIGQESLEKIPIAKTPVSVKKRARFEDEENLEQHQPLEELTDSLTVKPAEPCQKRLKISSPQQNEDTFSLPSTMPSTPPLSQDASYTSNTKKLDGTLLVFERSTNTMRSPSENNKSGKKINTFRSTFGARQVASDDEDDDFFEPIQAIRTPAKVVRPTAHEPVLRGISTSDEKSENLTEITPSKPEPQLPPQLTSVRDGTFALSQTPSCYNATSVSKCTTTIQQPQSRPVSRHKSIISTPKQQHSMLPAPPLYTLQTLRHPPVTASMPRNNVTVTVLAVISWLGTSLLHREGSPFPPKRHIKIVDPTLATPAPEHMPSSSHVQGTEVPVFKPKSVFQDSVTVAVYVDAADFKPVAGTIALFRGLVMQRLPNGDIILNAYARLKEQRFVGNPGKVTDTAQDVGISNAPATQDDNFSHWYITDPERIRALGFGDKMDYYLQWWSEKRKAP